MDELDAGTHTAPRRPSDNTPPLSGRRLYAALCNRSGISFSHPESPYPQCVYIRGVYLDKASNLLLLPNTISERLSQGEHNLCDLRAPGGGVQHTSESSAGSLGGVFTGHVVDQEFESVGVASVAGFEGVSFVCSPCFTHMIDYYTDLHIHSPQIKETKPMWERRLVVGLRTLGFVELDELRVVAKEQALEMKVHDEYVQETWD